MPRKRRPSPWQELCGQPGPEDGIDPRDLPRPPRRRRARKTWQLCQQVRRCLEQLSPADDALHDLCVVAVEPRPDQSRLLVLYAPQYVLSLPRETVEERLRAALPWLRGEVAAAVHRRKVPELILRLV